MRLEDVASLYLPWLYHGYEIDSCHAIRVTRDAEIAPQSVEAEDTLAAVESSLRERRMGAAVRLQYDADLPVDVLETLVAHLELEPCDLYPGAGFTAFSDLFQLYGAVDVARLKEHPPAPLPVPAFDAAPDVWSAIRAGDILVHHPYQSFDVVTRFVEEAALDPKVLAIKMTLYRVSPTSPIAQALTKAAEHGKEVAVLVELKARFDEEANIRWARALEAVGAHVVYGLPNFKTHCKACLVVRQEADGIRRYCHVATGNYNAKTAGLYADFGLFTCRDSFGEDLTELFNLLTGLHAPAPAAPPADGPYGPAPGAHRAHPARGGPRPGRTRREHRSQDEQPGRPGAHRRALRGEPRGGRHRAHRPGHLLLAAPGAGRVRAHPRRVDRRPLPRARARLLLRQRRPARGLPGLRRLDAEKPRPPDRDRVPADRSRESGRPFAPSCRCSLPTT